ncbi:MAG: hypothetical protein IJK89_12935 [Clostridia bacterium]|nr:hypothetical protein [Clostridia bacterium]
MITFGEAKQIVIAEKPNRLLLGCNELTDSWVFTFSYLSGKGAFDSPLRVYKDSGKIEKWDFLHPKNWAEFKEKYVRDFVITEGCHW